jgi:hypothetical protein
MSLQQLTWLGAAMSGVGVMLSFIYFAVEVRHNTPCGSRIGLPAGNQFLRRGCGW